METPLLKLQNFVLDEAIKIVQLARLRDDAQRRQVCGTAIVSRLDRDKQSLDFTVHSGDSFFDLADAINSAFEIDAPFDAGTFDLGNGRMITADDHPAFGERPFDLEVLTFVHGCGPIRFESGDGGSPFEIRLPSVRRRTEPETGFGVTLVGSLG